MTFSPSIHNPELAAINNQYFNLFEVDPYSPFFDGPYESLLAVQNGNAILNGQILQKHMDCIIMLVNKVVHTQFLVIISSV